MEFVVYILYSKKSGRNYTGFTSDLVSRFHSHNVFGKDSTRLYRPWIVVHVEFFDSKNSAMQKEKYYKSGRGSLKKREIIDEFIAHWAHTLPHS
jgi:putative endonuclease